MERAKRWSSLGLSIDTQCAVIREAIRRKVDSDPFFVPRSFSYFDGAMSDAAAAGSSPTPRRSTQQTDKEKRMAYLRKVAGQP